MKPELLAPAGDIEAAYAAFYYGADAIYLGLKKFSARSSATNFDENQLDEITAYAHHLNKKVYVTINTILQQSELDDLLKTLDICSKYKVDAVILQDLGVAHLIKTQYKELEMHASTQMAVHNYQGALYLKQLGFTRVVLARELSLAEINQISSIDGLETEVFIHGALCYSYSGICQFSALEFGKSANRGKCLYPCRSVFENHSQSGRFFSMKDLALENEVLNLKATSLKIEGRKKSALYVASVTNYYRHILDGNKPDKSQAENIKQIFSRPWCRFHLNGKDKTIIDPHFASHRGLPIGKIENIKNGAFLITPSHNIAKFDGLQIEVKGLDKPFGFSVQQIKLNGKNIVEGQKDNLLEIKLPEKYPYLQKGMDVFLASSSQVKGAYPYSKPKPHAFGNKSPIDVYVEIKKNELIAHFQNFSFQKQGLFEAAQNVSKVYDSFLTAFQKTGETAFYLNCLTLHNPDNLFVPLSVINELRRGLYNQIELPQKHGHISELPEPLVNTSKKFIIKSDDYNLLRKIDLKPFAEMIYLIDENTEISNLLNFEQDKLRLALPTICRKPDKLLPKIKNLLENGFLKWEVSNYWALQILDSKKCDIVFGPFLYMLNTESILMAIEMGASRINLSIEDTFQNLKELTSLSPIQTSLIVYQDTPLFTSAVCLRSNDCAHCNHLPQWMTFTKCKEQYQALSKNCQTMLFKNKPLYLSHEAQAINPSFYQIDFCYKSYTPEQAQNIISKVMSFEDIPFSYSANISNSAI